MWDASPRRVGFGPSHCQPCAPIRTLTVSLAKKHRGENWDPKAVKVVISTLKKIRKEQIERGTSPRSGKVSADVDAKKAIGKEGEKRVLKNQELAPERIVTKNDELKRQLSKELNPTRFRR
jgi:glycerate kinase